MTTTALSHARLRRLAVALSAGLLAVSASAADQVVYFVNGKAMMVKGVERGERFTILEMEGGGRMGVPTEQIARIEEYQVSAAAAPALVAPVASQTPIVATAPPAPAVVPAAGPTLPATGIGAPGQAYQSPRPPQAYPNRPAPYGAQAVGIMPPGAQRPAQFGPGGRRLGRQGMGRRGGPIPFAPPGAQPGQTTNSTATSGSQGSGEAEGTTPQDPSLGDPGEEPVPDEESPEEPAAGGAPQNPGGSS